MKTTRFSETQILKILKEAEAGVPVTDLCREHGLGKAPSTSGKPNTVGWTPRPCGD